MGKIHQLSELLSNQIAAGEVIERPASVVKELVENALDAGANKVQVFLKDAGLTQIQVIDNGSGFDPDDLNLAFLRHTTSKISRPQDLFQIHSLGFRGEALASIAAVSKVNLKTSTGKPQAAREMTISGTQKQIKKVSHPRGSTLTVQDLFYNTPARLKYLKSLTTELRHTADIMNRLALSYPQVAFVLVNDNRQLLQTTGSGDLQQTIAGIYGTSVAEELLPVQASDLDFKLAGFISKPSLTRSSKQYISLLINGRYIRNFNLNKALIAGYGTKLMVGRYPIAVINIKMDAILVDVNVHPTKREVRLSKEGALMTLLTKAVRQVLGQTNLIPDAITNLKSHQSKTTLKKMQLDLQQASTTAPTSSSDQDGDAKNQPRDDAQQQIAPKETGSSTTETDGDDNHDATDDPLTLDHVDTFKDPQQLENWDHWLANDPHPAIFNDEAADQNKTEIKAADHVQEATASLSTASPSPLSKAKDATVRATFPELRYLGQIHGTYLVAESDDGFYLIDQHAAQERIKYEQLRVQIGQVSDDQQNLLVPLVLTYSASDYLQLKNHLTDLAKIGLHLDNFGDHSFIMHTHPTWLQKGEEETEIRQLLDAFLTNPQLTVAQFREQTAILMSCKQSIKANHHLEPMQARQLLADLTKAKNPYNCPHGRPVLVQFSDQDLQRMFKRIQDSHQQWSGD